MNVCWSTTAYYYLVQVVLKNLCEIKGREELTDDAFINTFSKWSSVWYPKYSNIITCDTGG